MSAASRGENRSAADLYASKGGAEPVDGQPWVVFVHGASMNRTAWALPARYFAARGWNVAALDLPGHGRSPGPALTAVPELAATVAADLDHRAVNGAYLVGHSMGALIGVELAATRPDLVSRLALVGGGLSLAVNDALLDGSAQTPTLAVDAIVDWGFSKSSHLGNAEAPGTWLDGAGRALMADEVRRHPGSLHADFSACNSYSGGREAAARVTCPVLVVSASRDLMTPPKLGREAAAAVRDGRYVELADCGHMLMSERPKELIAELWGFSSASALSMT